MNEQCPHLDYGKSADKALGAYCTKKKKCVEKEDCEGCKDWIDPLIWGQVLKDELD